MSNKKFYEKVKNYNKRESGNLKFSLNYRRKVIWIFAGIMLISASSFVFMDNYEKGFNFFWIVSIIALIYGTLFIYMSFEYSINLDLDNQKIYYKKEDIDLENLEYLALKKVPTKGIKPFQLCLDIITKEKKQYIFPLIMHNRLKFVGLLKILKGDLFKMES